MLLNGKAIIKKDQRNASEKVAEAYKSKRPITIILHTCVIMYLCKCVIMQFIKYTNVYTQLHKNVVI